MTHGAPLQACAAVSVPGCNHAQDRHLARAEKFRRMLQCHFTPFLALAILVHSDAMSATERAYARLGPGHVPAGPVAQAVEQRGDACVVQLASQLRDECLNFNVGCPAMLTRPVLCVIAILPMDNEFDARVSYPSDDLLDDGAQNALARFVASGRMVPHPVQIGAQCKQRLALLRRQVGILLGAQRIDLRLPLRHLRESLIPASLELSRNEPIARIYGIELTVNTRGLEARLFKRQFQLPSLGLAVVRTLLNRPQRGLHSDGPQHGENFVRHRTIYSQRAE